MNDGLQGFIARNLGIAHSRRIVMRRDSEKADNVVQPHNDAGAVPADNTVEIYSWWIAGGEAQALALLIDLYKSPIQGVMS